MIIGKALILGDNISGDMIISKEYIRKGLPIDEMKHYLFSTVDSELSKSLSEDTIIVAGKNFGCGSSREYSIVLLKSIGIKCIIAQSFGRTFFRACINNGVIPIEIADTDAVSNDDPISIDEQNGIIVINGKKYESAQIPPLLMDIVLEGGLIPYYLKHGL